MSGDDESFSAPRLTQLIGTRCPLVVASSIWPLPPLTSIYMADGEGMSVAARAFVLGAGRRSEHLIATNR